MSPASMTILQTRWLSSALNWAYHWLSHTVISHVTRVQLYEKQCLTCAIDTNRRGQDNRNTVSGSATRVCGSPVNAVLC